MRPAAFALENVDACSNWMFVWQVCELHKHPQAADLTNKSIYKETGGVSQKDFYQA